MATLLIALLCIDTVLLAILIILTIVKISQNSKKEVKTCVVEKKSSVEPTKTQEAKTASVKEEVAPSSEQAVEEADEVDEIKIGDIESNIVAKRIPFAVKLLELDDKVQGYYDNINNAFYGYRKVNIRLSMKGVSYRFGKELIAKVTIRGKTMKLYLALDVAKFNDRVYFQKDSSNVKAYAEVPFTVKVKSDRGLKNALNLIKAMCEEKGIVPKTRVLAPLDSLHILKESISK